MLTYPGVITPYDIPGNPYFFASPKEKEDFWDQFKDKTPSFTPLEPTKNITIDERRINTYNQLSKGLIDSSRQRYESIKESIKGAN